MKVGDGVKYRGYDIERTSKSDYRTIIAHDTLKDAKRFIDDLLVLKLIVEVKDD